MAGKKKFDWLHVAISWGATIVIIGALFKILHLGGVWGNYMIGAGLGVEAFLFFLTNGRILNGHIKHSVILFCQFSTLSWGLHFVFSSLCLNLNLHGPV